MSVKNKDGNKKVPWVVTLFFSMWFLLLLLMTLVVFLTGLSQFSG